MKNVLKQDSDSKNIKKEKSNSYLLQDSVEKINKHWNEFSISISGDFSFEKINLFCKRLVNPEFEMF